MMEAPGLAESVPRADEPLAGVADAVPDLLLLVDDQACVRWANAAAERFFGMALEQGAGRSGMEFVHPDDLDLALLSMTSVQSKEVGTPIELRLRGAQGWRLVEVIGAPFRDWVLLSVRDLTERRRWEIAGDEDARFRSLMQNSDSITLLLEADGTVRTSSGAVTRTLGVDQEWLEGRPVSCLVRPEDRMDLGRAIRFLTGGASSSGQGPHVPRSVTVDLWLVRSDGSTVPFMITIKDLLDDPTVEGLVATGQDISDRVRTEQELRSTNAVLAATLDSTTDGILVVDRDNQITGHNQRFIEMFHVPPDMTIEGPLEQLSDRLLDKLIDPAAFVAPRVQIAADPEAHTHDLVCFIDGRIFERDSLPQRIDGRAVGRVWSFRDITEHQQMQEKLAHQAFHDPLTGLANTALFRDRIDHAVSRLQRSGGRLAVMFVDLDDFKTVNDSLGHSAGDQMLVTIGERLLACIRPGDTVARLGGDEFAILIDELTDSDDATSVAERIIDSLLSPIVIAGRSVTAGASIGITYGSGGSEADEVLRNADLAMYTAKAAGKNCYRVFEDDMHLAAVERLDLETRLRGAGDRGELVIHYQPIHELDGGRIVAMEALVRWNHPERGLLGPLSFIPFAEQGGLIDEIGHHVLVASCQEACRWIRTFGDDAPAVSVNLSPRQLLDPRFPDRVARLLHRCGLPPTQLILEITEGALMEDPVAAAASLEQLSRLGVRLAVDDFGTGYSSLAYLQKFPLDLLKIDGMFVDDSLVQPGWSLAEAILQIAQTLGLVAIAEGVESDEHVAALRDAGCDLAQGYRFSPPVAAPAARAMIATANGVGEPRPQDRVAASEA